MAQGEVVYFSYRMKELPKEAFLFQHNSCIYHKHEIKKCIVKIA